MAQPTHGLTIDTITGENAWCDETLFQVYLKLQDEHNIPAADFPDVDVMREKLKKYKCVFYQPLKCFFMNPCQVWLQQVCELQQSTDFQSGANDIRGFQIILTNIWNRMLAIYTTSMFKDVPRIMSLIPAEDIKKKSTGLGLIQGGVFERVCKQFYPAKRIVSLSTEDWFAESLLWGGKIPSQVEMPFGEGLDAGKGELEWIVARDKPK